MHNSRLTEKPRLTFLRELHAYRGLKRAYYLEMHQYEEAQQGVIMDEIRAIEAGQPAPVDPALRAPVHPICPSRFVTEGE
jgi:hypothetical protein